MTPEQINANLPPFPRYLGVRFTVTDPDRIVAELEVRPDYCTFPDTAHGGALMTFADTVGAVAAVVSGNGASTTTLESKTNFLSAAPVGSTLIAEATPLHRGRTTQVWTTRVTANGKLVSVTTQTQFMLPPRS